MFVASVAAVRLSVAEEEAGDAAAVGDALQKINERTSKKTCPLQKKQPALVEIRTLNFKGKQTRTSTINGPT